jgi:hypothetical protein
MGRFLSIGCGLLGFSGFCLVGLSVSAILALFSAPTDAASGFLGDVRADAWSTARSRMSADYQRDHTDGEVATNVSRIAELDTHAFAMLTSYEDVEVDEGAAPRARVEGTLYGPDGEAPVAFELSQVDGYWYVDLVAVEGRRLE